MKFAVKVIIKVVSKMICLKLIFLGMLLLFQSCFSIDKPAAEFNRDNKLYKATVEALINFAKPLREQYVVLLEEVVEDLKANKEKSKYEDQIKHMEKSIKDFQDIKGDTDEETLQKIIKLKRGVINAEEPSKEGSNVTVISEVFQQDGGKELAEDLRSDFADFIVGFNRAFKAYVEELSEKEKANHEDLIKWVKELQETDGFDNQ
uniref:Uncharacterized protein n=1 Tax=Glossina austeni TaxID=7395 RepID=A0A1A9VYZ7_GLOAU